MLKETNGNSAPTGRQKPEDASAAPGRRVEKELPSNLFPFFSRISHTLRNPLSGILMNAQMMKEEIPEHSPLQMYLRDILEGARAMEEILRHLLEFSAPEPPNPSVCSLPTILEEVLRHIIPGIDPATVRIHTRYEPGLQQVFADPAQVRTMLLHLLENGLEALPRHGGELQIRCRNIPVAAPGVSDPEHPSVETEILDNGCGIPRRNLENVFFPFFSTKTKRPGLGLSIALALCQINHGTLILESNEGDGTRVLLRLPVHSSPQGMREGTCSGANGL